MKGLIQRVSCASIHVAGECIASIDQGSLILIGFEADDLLNQIPRFADKLIKYRIFPDEQGRMNKNVADIHGQILFVPQFTLAAETQKGLRGGFSSSLAPDQAQQYFDTLIQTAQESYPKIHTGQFGANMQVSLINDGPVTFLIEM
ncbi:D-tyrosyl-tRNA(Tyr) deacylase [Piscirickettsia salmonis]|uniref:D-aminoacyl-tRNA deacylase n=1 Tax=Piscirickettsia salmonis TaxID=1238 RepID=A0A1L6TEY7_PISSA|nr:D-aminoacyl-tRNA deacylase [Piscirickettsia salmonis]AKP72475.1 D-tyrosyl-tRNA(Tyr) deacylase [Piscirickettsia salmonis LF-89 = ATCC VR-1361]ALB24061.1 D-tyrosyl-tRNA(Tyr) deacylase [Piscirickettsia salmonis]ALY03873.1 D-tyrosyl-tRNA(Tyr) deacylase [Piscirickettsia salmonis]AMA43436.1 D-tyrosyl-tRNA(Tyr) deacylase [Piscirickettsia salmonis]AOS35905.1 D-tyrosyl-tRNA(Tyr) deacylase [Piscirickettsia salmonis]